MLPDFLVCKLLIFFVFFLLFLLLKLLHFRAQSFLILGTGTEDLWQGYESFFHCLCGGTNILRAIFIGCKTISLKKFWMKRSKIESKINRHLEMMSQLNGMKISRGNSVSSYRSMFYPLRFLDGVLNHFAERCGGTKTIYVCKMGYAIFSYCAKLSSALVPEIKSDRSLHFLFFSFH